MVVHQVVAVAPALRVHDRDLVAGKVGHPCEERRVTRTAGEI
jgi:hypothetical protein